MVSLFQFYTNRVFHSSSLKGSSKLKFLMRDVRQLAVVGEDRPQPWDSRVLGDVPKSAFPHPLLAWHATVILTSFTLQFPGNVSFPRLVPLIKYSLKLFVRSVAENFLGLASYV